MSAPPGPAATAAPAPKPARGGGSLTVRLAVLLVGAALSGLFLIDLCNVVFDCGCRSLWAGAAAACNVHAAEGPRCPWCAAGWWGLGLPLAAVVTAQTALLLWPGQASLLARTLLAAAAFPAVGTTVAVLWGMVTGYWH